MAILILYCLPRIGVVVEEVEVEVEGIVHMDCVRDIIPAIQGGGVP